MLNIILHLKLRTQVQLYEGNVFSCDLQSGDMRPHSTMSISVKFMPQNPIPYHRMISLLIKYQVLFGLLLLCKLCSDMCSLA